MIRSLALILALLSPVAALAQTTASVNTVPAAFGYDDCLSTDTYVTIAWTTSVTPITGDVYRLYVSGTQSCPSTGTPAGTQLGGDITPTTVPQFYPFTLTRSEFIAAAGITTCPVGDPTKTIFICVQQWGAASTFRTSVTTSVPLYLKPPPQPVNLQVAPGDTALYVTWAKNPTDNTVPTSSYEVNAVASSPPNLADEHIQAFTGLANNRVTGLTNGVTYSVTVKSVSPGSNKSAATDEVYGTPEPVAGFWEQYHAIPGREQGGCTGGPAGLIALLGVALALGSFWRRS